MRTRLLGIGLVALGVAPIFAACGSDSKGFQAAPPADGGEGGAMDPPSKGGSGGSSSQGDGGAAGDTGGDAGAGGMAEMAGAGGEGGTPIVCLDQDGDGVTTCDGDCKDGSAAVFPGNPEICGDGLDNDCAGGVDDVCNSLGTFVATDLTTASDSNPGTMTEPVKTIAQGIANALAIQATTMAPIDVYVAQGDYTEKVTVSDGVSLLGAHACDDTACDWSRDASLYVSQIVNTDIQGVLIGHTVFSSTKVDGFTIQGFNAIGTAAVTIDGGSPTLSNNIIMAGVNEGGALWNVDRAIGVAILAPTNDPIGAIIEDNTILAGDSSGMSAGLLFDWPNASASPFKTYATVTGNKIGGALGKWAYGVYLRSSGDGTLIRDNTIAGGQGTGAESHSWGITLESYATIDSNRVNVNLQNAGLDDPSCAVTNFCGGIYSLSSTSDITNNVVFGVQSAQRSAAVYLSEDEVPAGTVVLNSNYLDGAGNHPGDGENISTAVALYLSGCCGNNGSIGRIANNIMVGGAGTHRFGLWESQVGGRYIHPDWLLNNDFYIDTSDTPVTAVYYRHWNNTAVTDKATIADVNTATAQFVSVGGNIDGDCDVDATYHLQAGSICIDAGVSYDAPPFDYEGDARPSGDGYDIGADEAG